MKIAYQHLIEYIIDKPQIDELSSKLFQLGHEHEVLDGIFDFEFTPNRGDCLSIKGLIRDLNLFYETQVNSDTYNSEINDFSLVFENHAKEFCSNISFLKIEVETVPNTYNEHLENFYNILDIKKNNFFTDVSNYISYETGQPTHCYDSKKIDNYLKLNLIDSPCEFETLADKTITLSGTNLVFVDKNEKVINLAGVMGGKSTSCKKDTKSVIVECAHFNPEIILGKAVKYSLNSEAAHKFERNVDLDAHEYVLRRFLKIVEQHCKIVNVALYSERNNLISENNIQYDLSKINQIIGTNLSEVECKDYLSDLGFSIDNSFIKVPSFRNDVHNLNDIAEEIARAIGYDNIKPKNFEIIGTANSNNNSTHPISLNVKNLLIDNGFYEVINNPFTPSKEKASIEVDNPLDSNKRFLRTSLKHSLINNLLYNERRQKDCVKLFEISKIYLDEDLKGKNVLGIIASGRVDKNHQDFNKIIDVKYLSNLLQNFITDEAILTIENIPRDSIGSRNKSKIIYMEFEVAKSITNFVYDSKPGKNIDHHKYKSISNFPSSTRDLSFSIKKDFENLKLLEDYILNYKNNLLKESFVFDYYKNDKNKEIKIGFRLVFQSNSSTITEKEVNQVMEELISYTKTISGISIPGIK